MAFLFIPLCRTRGVSLGDRFREFMVAMVIAVFSFAAGAGRVRVVLLVHVVASRCRRHEVLVALLFVVVVVVSSTSPPERALIRLPHGVRHSLRRALGSPAARFLVPTGDFVHFASLLPPFAFGLHALQVCVRLLVLAAFLPLVDCILVLLSITIKNYSQLNYKCNNLEC